MRESIGGTALFQITIVFLLLFTGVMCITINHSKAFAVKDEILDMIQNSPNAYDDNGNITTALVDDITAYITDSGYRITNQCPNDFVGYTRNGNVTSGKDASICIRSVNVAENYTKDLAKICNGDCSYINDDLPNMYYFDIILFYQIDAPVIQDAFKLQVNSSTRILYS